jgi:hypothetical protein
MNYRRNQHSLTRNILPPDDGLRRQFLPHPANIAEAFARHPRMVNTKPAEFRHFRPAWQLLPAGREIATH